MSVILVLDDDAPARAALAEQLGRLFPHVQVLTGTPAEFARVEVRAASRRGAGAPPAEARRDIEVRAASRRGAGAPPAEARRHIEDGSIVRARPWSIAWCARAPRWSSPTSTSVPSRPSWRRCLLAAARRSASAPT